MDPGSAKLSAALALVMASIGAAALRYRPPPARPADAPAQEFSASRAREVLGRLGAEAFVAGDPAAKEVGAVVNLEARGTTGASLMFETSDRSGWIVDLFAKSVPRPASNSIYYTIYKMLPNDTDLTVYKRSGLAGLNFAFIGGEARYHTPRDDFAHADPASLQHHGENALAMVRALARADLEAA